MFMKKTDKLANQFTRTFLIPANPSVDDALTTYKPDFKLK